MGLILLLVFLRSGKSRGRRGLGVERMDDKGGVVFGVLFKISVSRWLFLVSKLDGVLLGLWRSFVFNDELLRRRLSIKFICGSIFFIICFFYI